MHFRLRLLFLSVCWMIFSNSNALRAGLVIYGDKDVVGTGTYPEDPTNGATLIGLSAGVSTVGVLGLDGFGHGFPFSPSAGDYLGTDQIYVGSNQTGNSDGYSSFGGRLKGPQIITMDYSSMVPIGDTVQTLTLGIGFDDFQFPPFGNRFELAINGQVDAALTNLANSFNQTGPRASFASIGINTSLLNASHILTLSIDQKGSGGDGWAVDFLTVGVTSVTAVPEPSSIAMLVVGFSIALILRYRSKVLAITRINGTEAT